MTDEVHTVEWSQEAKEFVVVKVPRPTDAVWCQYENHWDAWAKACSWNDALRRHYNELKPGTASSS